MGKFSIHFYEEKPNLTFTTSTALFQALKTQWWSQSHLNCAAKGEGSHHPKNWWALAEKTWHHLWLSICEVFLGVYLPRNEEQQGPCKFIQGADLLLVSGSAIWPRPAMSRPVFAASLRFWNNVFFFPTFKKDGVNYSVIYRGSIRASNTIWIDSFFKPLQNGRIPDLSLMKAWTRPSWRKMIGSWISQEVLNGWCLGCQYTIFLGSLEDAGWLIPF